ncbi:unnamed protein product [Symbiodinium natans]|uniref:Apple domain-containing protein n=1 Tax=Symbiodinium natans TaxID=878477 RepID=A0A812SXL7_9DINO|nr:unnamed protein product [Symbiodinium natans]
MTAQLVLIGNPHGTSGLKNCAPVTLPVQAPATNAAVTAAPLSFQGELRPKCSFRGKALRDPSVQAPVMMASPLDCQSACTTQPTCQQWTFYNNTGGCWLQSANATEFASEFAVSGPRLCTEPVESSPYEAGHNITRSGQRVMMRSIPRPNCSNRGQAYHHPTIRTPTGAFVADAKVCQLACQAQPSCSKFTYYIDSKACWLLDDNVTTFESVMAISGPKACAEPIAVQPAARVILDAQILARLPAKVELQPPSQWRLTSTSLVLASGFFVLATVGRLLQASTWADRGSRVSDLSPLDPGHSSTDEV